MKKGLACLLVLLLGVPAVHAVTPEEVWEPVRQEAADAYEEADGAADGAWSAGSHAVDDQVDGATQQAQGEWNDAYPALEEIVTNTSRMINASSNETRLALQVVGDAANTTWRLTLGEGGVAGGLLSRRPVPNDDAGWMDHFRDQNEDTIWYKYTFGLIWGPRPENPVNTHHVLATQMDRVDEAMQGAFDFLPVVLQEVDQHKRGADAAQDEASTTMWPLADGSYATVEDKREEWVCFDGGFGPVPACQCPAGQSGCDDIDEVWSGESSRSGRTDHTSGGLDNEETPVGDVERLQASATPQRFSSGPGSFDPKRDKGPVTGGDSPETSGHATSGFSLSLHENAWTAAGTMGAMVLLAYAALRVAGFLIGSGMFTRIRKDQLLDHPTRQQLHDLISGSPGLHFREVLRRSGHNIGALRHHLRKLVEGGIVCEMPQGGYTCYYVRGAADASTMKLAPAVGSPTARDILQHVSAAPGARPKQLALALGVGPSLVTYHADRLVQAGLIEKTTEGRSVTLQPTSSAAQLLQLMNGHASGAGSASTQAAGTC